MLGGETASGWSDGVGRFGIGLAGRPRSALWKKSVILRQFVGGCGPFRFLVGLVLASGLFAIGWSGRGFCGSVSAMIDGVVTFCFL